jgi:HEPN domain-containing protein
LKTKEVDRASSANFLKKAEECLRAALESSTRGDWNAVAICAVHAVISGSDAVCTYLVLKHHSGESHQDAVELLRSIHPDSERFKINALRLSRILGIKHMAEYEKRLVFRAEAERALKDCGRFVAFVKEELGK